MILLHVGLEDSLIVEDEAALLAAVALLLRILSTHVSNFPEFSLRLSVTIFR